MRLIFSFVVRSSAPVRDTTRTFCSLPSPRRPVDKERSESAPERTSGADQCWVITPDTSSLQVWLDLWSQEVLGLQIFIYFFVVARFDSVRHRWRLFHTFLLQECRTSWGHRGSTTLSFWPAPLLVSSDSRSIHIFVWSLQLLLNSVFRFDSVSPSTLCSLLHSSRCEDVIIFPLWDFPGLTVTVHPLLF